MNLAQIGRRIQERREQLGMKQEELAESVNLSPNYISAIEDTKVRNIYKDC